MVAINRRLLSLFVALIALQSVVAQQIEPRIAGLEVNPQYMSLLGKDRALTEREDSIALIVESLRRSYRTAPAESLESSREQIISLENQLFELRANKAVVVDSLNLIEQEWVLNNMSGQQPPQEPSQTELVESAADLKHIYESPNVSDNLSSVDFKNLVKAVELEKEAEQLSSSYVVNYDNLLSLQRSYESTSSQQEAEKIMTRFDALSRTNEEILAQLSDTWGFIYDNKSFAYSMLMELLGFDEVLQQEAELMRRAQAEISTKQGVGAADELLYYLIQKSSMVEFELLVARSLGLSGVAESLETLSQKLKGMEKISPPELTIEERLFILYEPIEYVTSPRYTASNPIPETVVYDKGVIFRIYVGSFQTKPSVATFRNTVPISHSVNELKRHCYYIGGFATYDEAVEAQAELKKHGFRAPKIVVWSDGRERNLSTDPLPLAATYRVEISDVATLPEGATQVVNTVAAGSAIAKVATDKFVITSLKRQSQADSLVMELRRLDPELKIVVEKSEAKVEF